MDRDKAVIGIDLGATNIRAGRYVNGALNEILHCATPNKGTVQEVLQAIYSLIEPLTNTGNVTSIGIGVPSVVDVKEGIVYDVQHIASWVEVPLKKLMETRFQMQVYVNNDANCFAVGEYYFGNGKGKEVDSLIGLTLGTGLGAGVMINHKLYNGANCGAGEFGSMNYLDANLEYYASGSFFQNLHGRDGLEVFNEAKQNVPEALALYNELGTHIGQAIKSIMYAYDPEMIILGGSVSHGYSFFQKSMFKEMETFDYPKSINRIKIEVSQLQNSGVLGAAALYFDANQVQ